MELGSLDGWVSSVLSGIAILIGIYLAAKALGKGEAIADTQARREEESYLSGRMQGLVDHASATVVEARTIQDLASPRMSELLSIPPEDGSRTAERRDTVLKALTRLQVQVELLRVYAITMPKTGDKKAPPSAALANLMDEGAWLYGDALHAAILAFEEEPSHDADLSDNQSIVDALLNGSFVNLSTRLLSDCIGKNPDSIPSFSEPGSPWPSVYKRREKVLLDVVLSRISWRPQSLAEASVWSLDHTLDRFQDAMMSVLQEWNAFRLPPDWSNVPAHRR